MNKILYKTLLILFAVFISCNNEKTSEGVSRITYYNEIELIGDTDYVVEQGTPFVDPGAIASENDLDVSDNIVTSGTVDETTVGYYVITYEIENVDGFSKSIERNVFVLPTDRTKSDIYTGTYTGTVSTGIHADASEINHIGNGLYSCSDFIGGRYNIGFGYGPAYKLSGYFYVNGDGLSHDALVINSVWGNWDMSSPSLTGTTFSHGVSFGGGTVRDVILTKQ